MPQEYDKDNSYTGAHSGFYVSIVYLVDAEI